MGISKIPSGDGMELMVPGRIDGAAANELEVEILATIRSGAKTIYINLAEATFLCSAGLRVLLQYWRQMKNGGKAFYVTKPSPEVDAVLNLTGFREQMVEGAQPGQS
jgi:anti-anti-sigma factor